MGLLAWALSTVSIRDEDVYWHVLVGQAIADGQSLRSIGSSWSLAPDSGWVSTQWLAELWLAGLQSMGGWSAVASSSERCTV